MIFIELFAGIGGFTLGLERAGMQCVGQIELDDFCNKILEKHWPNVKRIRDIHDVKGGEFGTIELICGGDPCQPDSSAGKRKGTNDNRWLWPEMFRVIKIYRPNWVIRENVINSEGMGLKMVVADLESTGYKVRSFIIPNAACGLQTVERHIWTVATSISVGFERCQAINNTYNGEAWGFQGTDTGVERRWDLSESRVCRTRKRFSNQMDRVKALGNAVSPQIVEVIGRCIIKIENHKMEAI